MPVRPCPGSARLLSLPPKAPNRCAERPPGERRADLSGRGSTDVERRARRDRPRSARILVLAGTALLIVLAGAAGAWASEGATSGGDDSGDGGSGVVVDAGVRVVGGARATTEEHPWAVFLTDGAGFQFCGGTLVAPTKVLTAAHCMATTTPKQVMVVAGRDDKQSTTGDTSAVHLGVGQPRVRGRRQGHRPRGPDARDPQHPHAAAPGRARATRRSTRTAAPPRCSAGARPPRARRPRATC